MGSQALLPAAPEHFFSLLTHRERQKHLQNHHQHKKNTGDLMCALVLTVKEPAPLTTRMEGRHKLTSAGALLLSNLPSWYNLDSPKPCTDPLLFMDPFPCRSVSHPTPCCSTVAAGTRTVRGITPVLHPHFPVPFPENTLQASTQAVQGPLSPCEDRKATRFAAAWDKAGQPSPLLVHALNTAQGCFFSELRATHSKLLTPMPFTSVAK